MRRADNQAQLGKKGKEDPCSKGPARAFVIFITMRSLGIKELFPRDADVFDSPFSFYKAFFKDLNSAWHKTSRW